MSDSKLQFLKQEVSQDLTLQVLKDAILAGWPETRNKVSSVIHEYWNYRDELSYADGLILKGEKLVIPQSMRNDMLNKIHAGHMGMEKCKRRARDVMFWPRMNSNIEDLVSRCAKCMEMRCSQAKEPLMPHEVPERPWGIVASDLFYMNECTYLVIVDYYSRFAEISLLKNSTSKEVIMQCKSIFARHGIPVWFKSDNGPCYSSREFAEFAEKWGFAHITSSPKYPQSNGLAEKTVQTLKNMIKKSDDPYLGLLEYRNTPIDDIASPAQLLMSRRLRSLIQCTNELLKPSVCHHKQAPEKLKRKQDVQKTNYDKGAKCLPELI